MKNFSRDERTKLKAYYDSMLGQKEIFGDLHGPHVGTSSINALQSEVSEIVADFPDLIPAFIPGEILSLGYTSSFYDLTAVESYIARCVGRLKAVLEDVETTPVTERIAFVFIRDPHLREIIERDYVDIQRDYISGSWKSVIILSGGAIETILLDRLLQNESAAKQAKGAPSKDDLSRWDLSELIKVAVELKIIEPSANTLADTVRQYRNLVHPGYELRNKLTVGQLEADSAFIALRIVHRELSR